MGYTAYQRAKAAGYHEARLGLRVLGLRDVGLLESGVAVRTRVFGASGVNYGGDFDKIREFVVSGFTVPKTINPKTLNGVAELFFEGVPSGGLDASFFTAADLNTLNPKPESLRRCRLSLKRKELGHQMAQLQPAPILNP